MIKKGRHTDVGREFRFCHFCLGRNVYTVEDEFHFFMICPAYEELRNQYVPQHWRQNITFQHFYNIMELQTEQEIHIVSKFMISAFSFRNTFHQL